MTSDFPRLSQLARDASESLARAQQPALEALDRLAEIAWQALDPRSAPQGHPVGVDEWVVASTYSIYSAARGEPRFAIG